MLIIFDTNILIDITKGNSFVADKVNQLFRQNSKLRPAIAWVTYYEFLFCVPNKEFQSAAKFLDQFEFLEMDKVATDCFVNYKKNKTPGSDFDLLIASICKSNDAFLISGDRNFRNFGIKVLDL